MKTQNEFTANVLEEKILREANDEYFATRGESGVKHRITELQARCIVRAWIKNMMPILTDD